MGTSTRSRAWTLYSEVLFTPAGAVLLLPPLLLLFAKFCNSSTFHNLKSILNKCKSREGIAAKAARAAMIVVSLAALSCC